jgi:hypothetical protein
MRFIPTNFIYYHVGIYYIYRIVKFFKTHSSKRIIIMVSEIYVNTLKPCDVFRDWLIEIHHQ